MVCLGQASQSVDHQRQMSLMTRIIPKPKKCLVILARNDKVLKKSKELFGAAFYTAIHKYAKGNKQLREAKRELQSFKRRSGPQYRPFRQGPPQQQSGFRGGGGGWGGGTDNQVAVTQTKTEVLATLEAEAVEASPGEMTGTCKVGLSPNAQQKKRNHTIRFSEFTRLLWANRWFNRNHKAVGSGRHNYQLNRGEANPVPIQLVSNHSGQLGTTNDKSTVGQRGWRTAVCHLPTWRPPKQANKATPG